jgi:hypothetical protein
MSVIPAVGRIRLLAVVKSLGTKKCRINCRIGLGNIGIEQTHELFDRNANRPLFMPRKCFIDSSCMDSAGEIENDNAFFSR